MMSTSPGKQMTPEPGPAPSAGPQKLLMAGVVIILATIGVVVWLIATDAGSDGNRNEAATASPAAPNRGRLLPSGLRIETIREGTGRPVTRADIPLVRYELRVYGRGGVVESNFDDPQAVPMPLDGVVPGFAEALTHIRVGGESRFWVPPHLGYGAEPRPGAPFGPNDILEFRVRIDGIAGGGGTTPGGGNASNTANAAAAAPVPGQ
jgi:hypothetical protein